MLTSPLNKTILLKPLVNKANGLLHLLPHYKYASISGILTIAPWLLTTGFWDDSGAWDDSATWLELFTPSDLFAAGEQGVWYDPSDMSTMFQDAAGTTPVTAVDQPVGLILDKSKGLVLGPELVVNGDFATDTTGWSPITGATLSWETGRLKAVTTSASGPKQQLSLVVGKTYKVVGTVQSPVANNVSLGILNNAETSFIAETTRAIRGTATELTLVFVATETNSKAYMRCAGDGTYYLDNISVRELAGNHATQPTATARPILKIDGNGKHYLRFDGVDDFLVTNTITPGTDKAQVFAGVRKLSDAAPGMILELGAGVGAGDNRLYFAASANPTTQDYQAALGGINSDTPNSDVLARSVSGFNAPITNVLSITMDKAIATQDAIQFRVNGSDQTETTDFNAGVWPSNFAANLLYIGRRGGASLPFNGHLYSLITRFGSNLTTDQITQAEDWVNSKTGAY